MTSAYAGCWWERESRSSCRWCEWLVGWVLVVFWVGLWGGVCRLLSFPARRSSDLLAGGLVGAVMVAVGLVVAAVVPAVLVAVTRAVMVEPTSALVRV